MPQFQVPQFIETESKIVGPLTLKQFLYIAAAGLTSFLLFFILKFFIWVIITLIIGSIAAAFAFFKFNGRPLATILKSAFIYYWNPRLYLWQREEARAVMPQLQIPTTKETPVSKLKNTWLGLITKKPPTKPGGGV